MFDPFPSVQPLRGNFCSAAPLSATSLEDTAKPGRDSIPFHIKYHNHSSLSLKDRIFNLSWNNCLGLTKPRNGGADWYLPTIGSNVMLTGKPPHPSLQEQVPAGNTRATGGGSSTHYLGNDGSRFEQGISVPSTDAFKHVSYSLKA